MSSNSPSPVRRRLLGGGLATPLLVALLFCGQPVRAWAVAGLQRRGSGEFRRFGFLVYRATLWSGDDPLQPPLALRLDYQQRISGTAIAAASRREMENLAPPGAPLDDWQARMEQLFPDVAPGDHLLGMWQSDEARFMQGDRLIGTIRDASFARTFFGIWLDPRTSAPGLRAALLGRTDADA